MVLTDGIENVEQVSTCRDEILKKVNQSTITYQVIGFFSPFIFNELPSFT